MRAERESHQVSLIIPGTKKVFIFCLLSVLFLLRSPSFAEEIKDFLFPVSVHTLQNGLNVILSEDYSLPLVSVSVAYNAGSFHEPPDKAGLAYVIENLMFQGSANVGPMQHINFIHKIGGELNAVTVEDKTIFFQTVPSNQLALVLWLESDRMNALQITESKVTQSKRALIEEINHRKSVDPYLESSQEMEKALFTDYAYHHPIYGEANSIRALTAEDAQEFYSTYYRPNNAVLCITGNFVKNKVLSLIRKYFESIPKGNDIPPHSLSNFPETSGLTKTMGNLLITSPGFYLGYRLASPYSRDYYTLGIIEYILLRGKSCRLHRRLIKKERIALYLSGGIETKKNLAVLKIFVISNNEIMNERCLNAIFSEIDRLKTALISEKELQKVKNMFTRDYLNQFLTTSSKAKWLAETFLSRNGLDHLSEELPEYLKVTPSDIIGIMNRYFTKERILLYVKPK